jgi:hypothetical protein
LIKKFKIKHSNIKPYKPGYEPAIYHKIRWFVILVGVSISLGIGIYGLFCHESVGLLSKKHVVYATAFALVGVFILASMIRPGNKVFWISFVILLPLGYFMWWIVVLSLFLYFMIQIGGIIFKKKS